MLLSLSHDRDNSSFRLERAILHLVRGTLFRRPMSHSMEAAAFEAKIYSLVSSIMELHRFRDSREMRIHPEDRIGVEPNVRKEKIIADIIDCARIIKHEINENPLDNVIHMDVIMMKLDVILKYHKKGKPSTRRDVRTSSISSENEPFLMEQTEPDVTADFVDLPPMESVNERKKEEFITEHTHVNKKKQSSRSSLPYMTTFVTSNVGNVMFKQGNFDDTGTLNKGESDDERYQFITDTRE
ncbi:hypothetical protein [Paenibacillus sp. 481]|uniref:hypothetical protein n=1 Tax=Paenibacillus sp. 481 TaxID=2835869 RepID=UPI001E5F26BE|nr:hypothetical protein [Paenibacillus sp. 481]UHA72720.1 hypothetical protein KIK04_19095 [Paenibacillus sp. 481]